MKSSCHIGLQVDVCIVCANNITLAFVVVSIFVGMYVQGEGGPRDGQKSPKSSKGSAG